VTTRRLRRLFWRGAATLLVIAALVALAAVIGGDFDETDGEILATLGLVLLAGGVALAGLGLHEQGKAAPVSIAILVRLRSPSSCS
jgi:peptidoglycan/LPS O-acetylase OafA/YrhL